jgi:hypothetical protein
MTAAERRITATDILPPAQYAAEREGRRAAMMELKRARRVDVGPYCTFYFENYETMWRQVHEMLHNEKGGAAQLADELAAYNPLIPQGAELVATLMIEIEDSVRRGKLLRILTNIEDKAFFEIAGKRLWSAPERDAERTASDGKTSAVHFLRFRFAPCDIAAFRSGAAPVSLGVAHENYAHMAALAERTRLALAKDFE